MRLDFRNGLPQYQTAFVIVSPVKMKINLATIISELFVYKKGKFCAFTINIPSPISYKLFTKIGGQNGTRSTQN